MWNVLCKDTRRVLLYNIYCSIVIFVSFNKFHKLVSSLMQVNSFLYPSLGSEIDLTKYRVSLVSEDFFFCFVFLPSINQIMIVWDKVFKTGPSKICGRQPSKYLNGYGLLQVDHISSNCLKDVFRKFYSVHSWILCSIWNTNIKQLQTY